MRSLTDRGVHHIYTAARPGEEFRDIRCGGAGDRGDRYAAYDLEGLPETGWSHGAAYALGDHHAERTAHTKLRGDPGPLRRRGEVPMERIANKSQVR